MKKPAVIFDLDGVLINSVPVHYKSVKQLFSEIGINDYTFNEMLEYDVTRGAMNLIPRVLKDRGVNGNVKALLLRKKQLMKGKHIPLMPGVKQLIKKLKKEGYTIAVASNGTKEFVLGILKKHKINKYFSCVLTGNDIKHHKPNPEIYKKMAKCLKVKPRDCIVIEDSRDGTVAGKRAGMTVIGHKVKIEKQDLKRADVRVSSMRKITPEFIEHVYKN